MIEVAITSRMKEWAKKKANSHVKGKRFDENINRRDSVYIGYLGESVFWEENKKARHIDNSGYDFLLNNKKIEVKAYWSQFKPRPSFYLKIPTQDIKRTAEGAVYSFICIDTSSDRAWYLGTIGVDDFTRKRELRKKGETQKGSGFKYTTDCYEIQVSDLTQQTLSIEPITNANDYRSAKGW